MVFGSLFLAAVVFQEGRRKETSFCPCVYVCVFFVRNLSDISTLPTTARGCQQHGWARNVRHFTCEGLV